VTALETRELVEEREYTATAAAKILRRSKFWVSQHAVELGGYRDHPHAPWHIPWQGIAAYQRQRNREMQS